MKVSLEVNREGQGRSVTTAQSGYGTASPGFPFCTVLRHPEAHCYSERTPTFAEQLRLTTSTKHCPTPVQNTL